MPRIRLRETRLNQRRQRARDAMLRADGLLEEGSHVVAILWESWAHRLVVAVVAVVGLRAGSGMVSARWEQSLDVGSGQFLVAVSMLLMAIITALSMLAVARTHADVGEAGGDESVAEPTRSQEAG